MYKRQGYVRRFYGDRRQLSYHEDYDKLERRHFGKLCFPHDADDEQDDKIQDDCSDKYDSQCAHLPMILCLLWTCPPSDMRERLYLQALKLNTKKNM